MLWALQQRMRLRMRRDNFPKVEILWTSILGLEMVENSSTRRANLVICSRARKGLRVTGVPVGDEDRLRDESNKTIHVLGLESWRILDLNELPGIG